jgi:hypothetical protein
MIPIDVMCHVLFRSLDIVDKLTENDGRILIMGKNLDEYRTDQTKNCILIVLIKSVVEVESFELDGDVNAILPDDTIRSDLSEEEYRALFNDDINVCPLSDLDQLSNRSGLWIVPIVYNHYISKKHSLSDFNDGLYIPISTNRLSEILPIDKSDGFNIEFRVWPKHVYMPYIELTTTMDTDGKLRFKRERVTKASRDIYMDMTCPGIPNIEWCLLNN